MVFNHISCFNIFFFCPNLVVFGCGCHSAHLCASAACLKLPKTVEQFARDVYNYFVNSTKRKQELQEFQIFAEEVVHKILKLSTTRWLSFINVVNRILEQWSPLTLYFQSAVLEDDLHSARPILEALHNPAYKLYFKFLSHALTWTVKLNLQLQREKPQIATLLKSVTEIYKSILKCFIKSDILSSTDLSRIQVDYPRNFKPLEEMYFGAKVDAFIKSDTAIDPRELHNFRLRALDFYIELAKQIKMRFDFKNSDLLYASNFSVENVLSGNIMSISEYVNLYPSIDSDPESVNLEWQLLPEVFNLQECSNLDDIDFWSMVEKKRNGAGELVFSNLMKVVKYIMVFPHSSAAAERTFSQYNLIKSKLRNRLKVSTAAAILRIKDGLRYNVLSYRTITLKEISRYLEQQVQNVEQVDDNEDIDDVFELLS
ncbi:uncharacterized protein LOC127284325 [Leptopilina boulardi]|uniref:uncharacterized protein LOC127284325 n=1 Tax=Leptopilina boulardi TaxID=63433 RepID=UPI0021F5740B|nr:uncharacterized protein LOC127284325 [Leptopilina boulardi]